MSLKGLRASTPPPPGLTPIATGTFALNGISVVNVAVPGITGTSPILLSTQLVSGVLGVYGVTSQTAGVGFSVTSVALNTSTIQYWVF